MVVGLVCLDLRVGDSEALAGMVHGVREGFERIGPESRTWAGGLAGTLGPADEVFADHDGEPPASTEHT